MPLVRGVALSSFLLLGALVAHHGAGGQIGSQLEVFISLLFLAVITAVLVRKMTFDGPQLACAILIIQNCVHFIYGTGLDSNLIMLIMHLLSGFITYKAAAAFDLLLSASINYFIKLIIPTKEDAVISNTFFSQRIEYVPRFWQLERLSKSSQLRSPPFFSLT